MKYLGKIENAKDLINKEFGDSNYIEKKATMPTASAALAGKIIQFIGETTTTAPIRVNGYFYKCVEDTENPGNYIWTEKAVQSAGAGSTPDNSSIILNDENKLAVSYGGKYRKTGEILVNGMTVGTAVATNIYEITSAGATEASGFGDGHTLFGNITFSGTAIPFEGKVTPTSIPKGDEATGEVFDFFGVKIYDNIPGLGVPAYFGKYSDMVSSEEKYIIAIGSGDMSPIIASLDLLVNLAEITASTIRPEVIPIDGDSILINTSGALEAAVKSADLETKIAKTETIEHVWSGTLAEYNALETKDSKTIYNITDDLLPSVDVYTKTETNALLAAKLDATKCTFQTTAPTAAISDGGVHIVHLASSTGVTEYNGYIYMYDEA